MNFVAIALAAFEPSCFLCICSLYAPFPLIANIFSVRCFHIENKFFIMESGKSIERKNTTFLYPGFYIASRFTSDRSFIFCKILCSGLDGGSLIFTKDLKRSRCASKRTILALSKSAHNAPFFG